METIAPIPLRWWWQKMWTNEQAPSTDDRNTETKTKPPNMHWEARMNEWTNERKNPHHPSVHITYNSIANMYSLRKSPKINEYCFDCVRFGVRWFASFVYEAHASNWLRWKCGSDENRRCMCVCVCMCVRFTLCPTRQFQRQSSLSSRAVRANLKISVHRAEHE